MPLLVKLLLPSLMTWLQSTVRNPKPMATERKTFVQIRDYCDEILTGMDALKP